MSLIQPIHLPTSFCSQASANYQLHIYRGDLEHPNAPGNKWHKLHYHLAAAREQGAEYIATFGGPFSNHLHAFGMTLRSLSIKGIVVVRGELQPNLTPTLQDLANVGIDMWPSTRVDYRLAMESNVVRQINECYGNVYWIPEGGGGLLGAKGCLDWAKSIGERAQHYDAWVVSSGTGTTAAGFLAFEGIPDLHVYSALKGEGVQTEHIQHLAFQLNRGGLAQSDIDRLFFHDDCHQGGFAKHSNALIQFLDEFNRINPDIILDPVYTSKSMLAVISAMKDGSWPYPRTLFIHTGGLQGWRGYSKDTKP